MRLFLVALLATATFAGCADPEAATHAHDPWEAPLDGDVFASAPDAGTPIGSPEGHKATATREDSAVQVSGTPLLGFGTTASKTVKLSNGFGGASLATIAFGIQEGNVRVETVPGDGYEFTIVLTAQAETEPAAREALDQVTIAHDDQLRSDGLRLTTGVRYDPPNGMMGLPQFFGRAFVQVEAVLSLPAAAAYDLWATTEGGSLSAADLRGPHIHLQNSGGELSAQRINTAFLEIHGSRVTLDQVAAQGGEAECGSLTGTNLVIDSLIAHCSAIDVQGRFGDLDLNATNSDLLVAVEPLRDGTFELWADGGELTLSVDARPEFGYDIEAMSEEGTVTIELPEITLHDAAGENNKTAKSLLFDDATTKTRVVAYNTSGNVIVQDAAKLLEEDEEDP